MSKQIYSSFSINNITYIYSTMYISNHFTVYIRLINLNVYVEKLIMNRKKKFL